MISDFVKEGRLAKGYTQKELSELSNISVRSIQRIENGDIQPRSYTLKALSEILGISFENIRKAGPDQKPGYKINKGQKIILSIGISLFILLLSWAFIAQSSRFPETTFEFFIFSAFVLLVITAMLIIVWRTKS
ncbi:MAG: multiprotein-bridging factor 1 family protein [Chitinophagales bacterium]